MSLSREWLQHARSIVGGDLLIMDEEVEPYSHDEFATDEFRRRPEAVARPHSEAEVARLVAFCAESGVPVTARGAGTGLSGSCLPSPGGIVLSLERLNRVIDADRANHTITVQAGMTLGQLYREAEAMGLYFPPHPGDEGAFVGGAVATNAGGLERSSTARSGASCLDCKSCWPTANWWNSAESSSSPARAIIC